MYKQNLKCKLALSATLQDIQSSRYCKTIRKNLHCHFHCVGYQRQNNACNSSIANVRCVQAGRPRCVHCRRVSSGSPRGPTAHPARVPTPATSCPGGLLHQGRHLCPGGLPPRVSRSVPKHFQITPCHKHSINLM